MGILCIIFLVMRNLSFFLSMYLFYLVFFIAAEELVKKIEAETMPVSIDAESSGNKPGSSGKKGKFKIY